MCTRPCTLTWRTRCSTPPARPWKSGEGEHGTAAPVGYPSVRRWECGEGLPWAAWQNTLERAVRHCTSGSAWPIVALHGPVLAWQVPLHAGQAVARPRQRLPGHRWGRAMAEPAAAAAAGAASGSCWPIAEADTKVDPSRGLRQAHNLISSPMLCRHRGLHRSLLPGRAGHEEELAAAAAGGGAAGRPAQPRVWPQRPGGLAEGGLLLVGWVGVVPPTRHNAQVAWQKVGRCRLAGWGPRVRLGMPH